MLNTIILVIVATAFAISFIRVVFDLFSMKLHASDIIICILCALVIYYSNVSYNHGYNDAIHSAELVETTEDNYYISFDGEIHEYK